MSKSKFTFTSKKTLFIILAAATVGSAGLVYRANADTTNLAPTTQVQFLGINDFHGNIATTNTANLPSGTVKGAGTAALLAGYLNQYQSAFATANPNGTTFRLQAGDMISASPAESSLIYDQPTIAALHAMNFEVGTLGNHEFDKGLPQLATIMNGLDPVNNDTSTAAQFYKAYSQQDLSANWQVVIANLVNKSDGQIPNGYKPYTILEHTTADGQVVKIGVIGVITTETPSIVISKNVEAYNFTDPAEAIAKYSKILQSEGVNALVVLGHTASDNSGTDGVVGESADIIKKLDQIDPTNSVDLYLAGHSHTYTNGTVDKVRVVQALSFGEAFDNVEATYDFATKDFTAEPTAEIVAVDPNKGVTPDPTVTSIVANAKQITYTIAGQTIGTYENPNTILLSGRTGSAWIPVANLPQSELVDSSGNKTGTTSPRTSLGESYLGQFITQAQLNAAQNALPNLKIDFAMTNNGGIRSDLNDDASSGAVTWGQAQAVQPFRNVLDVVSMTGQQIKDALNQQTFDNQVAGGNQLFLQEYGIKYTVTDNPNLSSDPTHPYIVAKMTKLDGNPINMTETYNVVINEFIKGGGDGFTAFADPSVKVITGFQGIDTEAFVDYIKELTAAGKKIPSTLPQEKFYASASDLANEGNATKPDYTEMVPVYRLFNKVNKAHLWTLSLNEYNTLGSTSKDWVREGIAWQAPKVAQGNVPVYRVYNPKSGEHLYTMSSNEVKVLSSQHGWKSEGVAYYSAPVSTGKPVYRLFNAHAGVGAHFVTSSLNEKNTLVTRGWKYEGIAWYIVK